MKREVISHCPICENELTITRLHCDKCQIEINGAFTLSKLSLLTKEQLSFVEVFLKNSGSIKAIEKDMNISYPTVKKLLSDVLKTLGYEVNDNVDTKESLKRQEILDKLANKEITYEEATTLLKNVR
ncbi:MAG: DUF2089 domain-containing protein [Bacilli bacterium]|nr:DUF2089 domain-containing protein [Bacilli bacterium]